MSQSRSWWGEVDGDDQKDALHETLVGDESFDLRTSARTLIEASCSYPHRDKSLDSHMSELRLLQHRQIF